jgi:hypothetical protein
MRLSLFLIGWKNIPLGAWLPVLDVVLHVGVKRTVSIIFVVVVNIKLRN